MATMLWCERFIKYVKSTVTHENSGLIQYGPGYINNYIKEQKKAKVTTTHTPSKRHCDYVHVKEVNLRIIFSRQVKRKANWLQRFIIIYMLDKIALFLIT